MKENKKGGFTLIELVVVIAIIAILALIIVPNLTAYIAKGDETKIKANLKNIHTAAETVEQTEGISLNVSSEDEGVILVENKKFTDKLSEYSNNKEVQVGEDFVKEIYTVSRNKASGIITTRFENKVGDKFTFNGSQFTGGSAGEAEVVSNPVEWYRYDGGTILGFDNRYISENYDGVFPTDLVLPGISPDGVTITAIGERAFQGRGLTSVVFPNTLEVIGETSFAYNPIKAIALPEGLKAIGRNSFISTELVSVVIPGSLESIGEYSLPTTLRSLRFEDSDTAKLTVGRVVATESRGGNIKFNLDLGSSNGSNIKIIGENFMSGNDNYTIEELVIPNTVEAIEDHAFRLVKVGLLRLGDSVESIGVNAFLVGGDGSEGSLGHLVIPGSVKHIGQQAFNGAGITKLTLNEGLKVIGQSAFILNNELAEVVIPASVESIESGAFTGNANLLKVTIKGYPSVVEGAFNYTGTPNTPGVWKLIDGWNWVKQ